MLINNTRLNHHIIANDKSDADLILSESSQISVASNSARILENPLILPHRLVAARKRVTASIRTIQIEEMLNGPLDRLISEDVLALRIWTAQPTVLVLLMVTARKAVASIPFL